MEVVWGETRNRGAVNDLIDALAAADADGTLYVGYPILASADEPVTVDALWTSDDHGLVAFDLTQLPPNADRYEQIRERQDDVYAAIQQRLLAFRPLRRGRGLAVDIHVITVVPALAGDEGDNIVGSGGH